MKRIAILFTALSILMSSCASILNSKYQKITIVKEDSDELLIDGKVPEMKNGQYLVKRDRVPKQITIKSEGYKDANKVIMQYKKSPLYFFSVVPFGILFYPMFYDKGAKAFNYGDEAITFEKTPDIIDKTPEAKEIKINKIDVDIEKGNTKSRYFRSYKNYLKKEQTQYAQGSNSVDDIKIENSYFAIGLNEILKNKGYIDTTRMALKNSYLDNLLINATITDYTVHSVANLYSTGMVFVDLSIDWEVLDYYEKPIYTTTTTNRSGQFAVNYNSEEVMQDVINDVIENGLIEFMQSEQVNTLLFDKSQAEKETNMAILDISKAETYVSQLSESIGATLTIKSEEGFGSGFIISSDGYDEFNNLTQQI